VKYEPVTYAKYRFPKWAEYIGWCIALSSILAIPIYAIILFARQSGTFKEVRCFFLRLEKNFPGFIIAMEESNGVYYRSKSDDER
jgi:amino acid transporter